MAASLYLESTRQVSDVVQLDEDILRPKGGRHVQDDTHEIQDLEKEGSSPAVRQVCALTYLEGYPDTKVIDPVKENFPACTMPLSCTTPHITPAILRNRQSAKEYLAHVALIRELLDQSSLTTNTQLLSSSSNRLYQSLSGLLAHSSDISLTRCDSAETVRQMTKVMDGKNDISWVGRLFDRLSCVLHKGRAHPSLDQGGTLLEESSPGHSQYSAAIQALH